MAETLDLKQYVTSLSVEKVVQKRVEHVSLLERIFAHKITDRDRAEFCLQLSVMLQARISIQLSLSALAKQTQNRRMRAVIVALTREIREGNSFAKALSKQPAVFDNLFVVTAEVGQESGRLAEVLDHLAHHLEKINALKKKFLQALTYPFVVISVAFCAVTFMLVFIVPTFAEMFRNFQMELPTSTKVVLRISDLFIDYGKYALVVAVGTIYISWRSRKSEVVKRQFDMYALKVPLIGNLLLSNHVARFCRTLGTMLKAQVSLLDAIEITHRITANAEMKNEIRSMMLNVKKGNSIAQPLVESRYFPPIVAQMIAVGEETSELDSMLLKVADYYEKELDGKVESLSSIIEPVLILFLGMIVASILISMYMPMFDLVNVVGGG